MKLDFDSCYQALRSRDPRFDGRFFTAVVTTGVYCRPICPAPSPKIANIRFYACAAAAEGAGFRPCRRCRPETSPGTPAWIGASITVSRALRLIAEGALDEDGVEMLATRLGVGGRHLRRLFHEELGTTPLAVAQTRRLHFARRLLDETDLPIGRVAEGAGFRSLRRFNDAIHKTFGKAPRELRRAESDGGVARGHDTIRIRIAYRPPYDWQSIFNFLRARAIPGVEVVGERSYARTAEVDGAGAVLTVTPDENARQIELSIEHAVPRDLITVVERVKKLFDCTADPLMIGTHLARDPLLRSLVRERPGMRVPGAYSPFEVAVRAILGQQVTVKGATTLSGRLVQQFGTRLNVVSREGLTHLFPAPTKLAEADMTQLGIPRARAETIRSLARAIVDGTCVLRPPADLDGTIDRLKRIAGIGEWTAAYIAMRAVGEPDAFPSGDLHLRRAVAGRGRELTARRLEEESGRWRPWRAYAAMYLWLLSAQEEE